VAGGEGGAALRVAFPAEAVAAVVPPCLPDPPPPGAPARVRGLCAHRGEVLPVIGAAECLGLGDPSPAPAVPAPLLRLAGPWPLALRVTEVLGLRRLPPPPCPGAVWPGGDLIEAVALLDGEPLPVCRPSALLAAAAAAAAGRGLSASPPPPPGDRAPW
jgi:chemotaxis signal transduction protein